MNHPAIDNLQDDLAMASLHNPYPAGSQESEAFQQHLIHASKPQNMHNYLGRGLEEIIHGATKAAQSKGKLIGEYRKGRESDMPTYGDSVTSHYD